MIFLLIILLIACLPQVKNHPVKAQPPEQSGSVILAKEPTLQVHFYRSLYVILLILILPLFHFSNLFLSLVQSWHSKKLSGYTEKIK